MSTIKTFKTRASVQEEAANWVLLMDRRRLNNRERDALNEWLAESRTNEQEFRELSAVWGLADELPEQVHPEPVAGDRIDPHQSQSGKAIRHYGRVAAAACILVVSLVGVYWGTIEKPFTEDPGRAYVTEVGQITSVTLADGSRVTLNTDSKIQVRFSDERRLVELSSGEANFNVAKDPQRPFSVRVGEKTVTAIGTVFNIRKREKGADLTVTEGKVSIDALPALNAHEPPAPDALSQRIFVSAGEEAKIEKSKVRSVSRFDPGSVNRKLAWRSGMLSFDNTPLSKAVAEVSRYTQTDIVIGDASLNDLKVGGYFKAGETQSMLEVLELSFNIKVEKTKDNVIVLKKNDDPRKSL